MIAILDYGSGNIRSAQRACERAGLQTQITRDYEEGLNARGLVIPGVGAFASCMKQLRVIAGDRLIKERIAKSRPILGICVGMQILYQSSEEGRGDCAGIGALSGKVSKLPAKVLPQIGWNTVATDPKSRLFKGLNGERFYFVHSFAALDTEPNALSARSDYGASFIAGIESGAINAVQFHPEKSGAAGIQLLRNWAEML